jgi:ribulose-5-phosphate 4-epimerase/fuculose-1-phosphate aldolase
MSDLESQLDDLVAANRILAHEGVVDAFGHVSLRHPVERDRFFLSCSRAPELVTRDDLMLFDLAGQAIGGDGRPPYTERFIHSALYEMRADVGAVIHNHSPAVIPFGVTGAPIRPLIHLAGIIGLGTADGAPPLWDIRTRFGETDLLVRNQEHGRDLAHSVGSGRVALMRGHGCVVAAATLRDAVMTAIYLQLNATLQMQALRLGEPTYLSPGEITRTGKMGPIALERAWEYWRRRAGC